MPSRLNLDRLEHSTRRASKLRGAYLGVVTSNSKQGGDSRYRVKLKFPWLSSDEESHWARIAVPMAGKKRGTYFLPEVDDQVLVVFEHGDIRRPIVIGALWSRAQPPPETNDSGQNELRIIKSRSGHRLIFDDTEGSERLIVVDSSRKNKVLLDSAGDAVTIESGDGDIEIIASTGTAFLKGKNVKLTASKTVKVQGVAGVEMTAGGKLILKSGAMLALQGANVTFGPGGAGAGGGGGGGGGGGQSGDSADSQEREESGGGGGEAGAGEEAPESGAGETAEESGGDESSSEQRSRRRRQAAAVAAVAVGGAAVGTAAARSVAMRRMAREMEKEPAPPTPIGARPSQPRIQPGQPVQVSAAAPGVTSADFEVIDADTGSVVGSGPAAIEDGIATATWDSSALAEAPDTENVQVRVLAGDKVSETPPIAVEGRAPPQGAPSPSTALADPREPMPAALAETAPSASPAEGELGAGGAGEVGGAIDDSSPGPEPGVGGSGASPGGGDVGSTGAGEVGEAPAGGTTGAGGGVEPDAASVAGGAGTGAAEGAAAGAAAGDADSATEGAARGASRGAREESGLADAQRSADSAERDLHEAERSAERKAGEPERAASAERTSAEGEVSRPGDQPREVQEGRATIDAEKADAERTAGTPQREAAQAERGLEREAGAPERAASAERSQVESDVSRPGDEPREVQEHRATIDAEKADAERTADTPEREAGRAEREAGRAERKIERDPESRAEDEVKKKIDD